MNGVIRIAILLAWAACSAMAAQPRVALVIGNARYEKEVGPLRNTVNDARAMSKALRSLGFTVIEQTNITRDDLLKSMLLFRQKLAGAEVGLFYFSGHGIHVSGANYLLPVRSGYAPGNGDPTALRLMAETRLFNAEQAVADMSAAGARCNIVILDACRSTPVARDPRARDITAGGLTEMKPPAGSLIAFATDAGRTASDGDGINGLYTDELLKHLKTPGLSIEQVFKRTREGVMRRSEGAQIPAEYSRLVGEDIFLAGAEPALPKPATPPTIESANAAATSGDSELCIELLKRRGTDAKAAQPLGILLNVAKEHLRDARERSARSEAALKICDAVLDAIESLLPAGAERNALVADAHNRRGDALLLHGDPQSALAAFTAAVALEPADAYIRYNRGRAYAALDRRDEARADFTMAASAKFKQPGARRLAQAALKSLDAAPAGPVRPQTIPPQ